MPIQGEISSLSYKKTLLLTFLYLILHSLNFKNIKYEKREKILCDDSWTIVTN